MATNATKPAIDVSSGLAAWLPPWPTEPYPSAPSPFSSHEPSSREANELRSGRDAFQALLAFSALHQQVRQRRALAARHAGFETLAAPQEFEPGEQFVLDEVLQLVAQRAVAITGADGLGIALAENNEIVLRASAGSIKPDVGARIQRDSAFSGACFRTAQIIRCDDSETDERVNLYACRQLGARSMVAVPLCGRRRVIGLLEAFSAEPFGFNDSDMRSLELLAEIVVGALKPEDEDRFAESAQVAEAELSAPASSAEPAFEIPKPQGPLGDVASSAGATFAHQTLVVIPVEAGLTAAMMEPAIAVSTCDPQGSVETSEPLIGLEEQARSTRHPGMVLVLVLVVVSAVLAGGLWWKLKNAQLSGLLKAEEKIAKSAGTNPPTPVVTSANTAASRGAEAAPPSNSATAPPPNTPVTSGRADYSAQEALKLPRITGVRHWSSPESSTVVLDLEDQVQYEAHRLANPARIYFDLHDTAVPAEIDGKTIEIGDALLARVRVSQPAAGLARVVLDTNGNPDFSVSLEPNPYRLVVQVRKFGAVPKDHVNLFPGAALTEPEKMAIMVPPPTREDLQLRGRVPKLRIVVDAGHGGWDLGTVGRRGLLEKDLVLEIAQRLGKLLESRLGADVVFTRKDDNYIPLDERAGIANQSQADLFISVHANYSDLPSARGVETYYTNFFSAPGAKEQETQPNDFKPAASVSLSPGELHEKIEQSRRLAASVQRSLYGTLSAQNPGLRDRGVKEASYVVLTETAMPGILAEVSFVSSPTDEQKLRNDGYREQIAEALYHGIARYAAASRGVKVASAIK